MFLSAQKYAVESVRSSQRLQATSKGTKPVNSVFWFETVDLHGFKMTALELVIIQHGSAPKYYPEGGKSS